MGIKKTPLINREISWLHFNERVLQEACDETLPLIERLKFLGIFSNNLDEFYRVRVATIRRMMMWQQRNNKTTVNHPEIILTQINASIKKMQGKFSIIYDDLLKKLAKANIHIVNEKQLTEDQGLYVKEYFNNKVRTNLFPLMLNNSRELTSLKDKLVYLAVCMENTKVRRKKNYALVKVPTSVLSRFLVLPEVGNKKYVIILDDIIRYCLSDIFSIFDYDTFSAYTIKFSRDAELDIDNDVEKSLMEKISESLKQRKKGAPVRFVYDKEMPDSMLEIILKKLKVSKKDSVVAGDRYHNFKDFMAFANIEAQGMYFEPHLPISHPALSHKRSTLNVLKTKDVLLHFPYHSFKHIIDLLREASIDPMVTAVKMTIYRVAKNSNVINALINAARNGKQVTVFLELQARFDEEANINWSKKLAEEGVKVLHGRSGLKVHSKLILIKRLEKGGMVSYANIGTGNFNEETAGIYSDHSLLTSHAEITSEVEKVFRLLETNYSKQNFKQLIVSPFNTRTSFIKLINNEITHAKKGNKAQIILKLNSLVDEQIVKKLYEASSKGVEVKIIARGICILIPGIKGISENIEAISIVGRFLEHSRIYYFYNNGDSKIFLSSADFMTRNIDHRIEVSTPVFDINIKKQLFDMLQIQLQDNTKARWLSAENCNIYKKIKGQKPLNSQQATYDYLIANKKTCHG